jgi:hypothetical protein
MFYLHVEGKAIPETIGCSGIKDSGKEVRNMEGGNPIFIWSNEFHE